MISGRLMNSFEGFVTHLEGANYPFREYVLCREHTYPLGKKFPKRECSPELVERLASVYPPALELVHSDCLTRNQALLMMRHEEYCHRTFEPINSHVDEAFLFEVLGEREMLFSTAPVSALTDKFKKALKKYVLSGGHVYDGIVDVVGEYEFTDDELVYVFMRSEHSFSSITLGRLTDKLFLKVVKEAPSGIKYNGEVLTRRLLDLLITHKADFMDYCKHHPLLTKEERVKGMCNANTFPALYKSCEIELKSEDNIALWLSSGVFSAYLIRDSIAAGIYLNPIVYLSSLKDFTKRGSVINELRRHFKHDVFVNCLRESRYELDDLTFQKLCTSLKIDLPSESFGSEEVASSIKKLLNMGYRVYSPAGKEVKA
mgnify:CR=1 FL=1